MALKTGEEFTKEVLKRYEDIPNPRLREVMQAAVKHLHAFVSEVKPNGEEWFKAIQYLTAIGQKCDDKRQEFILLSDTLGVSMLVDDINNRRVAGATPSTVEGPFHIPDSPEIADGGDMAKGAPGIPVLRDRARSPASTASRSPARCSTCGRPTAKAFTRSSAAPPSPGCAASITRMPTARSACAPSRRSATAFRWTARSATSSRTPNMSHIRPAHIHFAVSAPGHHYLVTHLFQKGDKYINNDVVYGVKEPLVVEFVKKPPGKAPNGETIDTPFYEVKYDFVWSRSRRQLAAAE